MQYHMRMISLPKQDIFDENEEDKFLTSTFVQIIRYIEGLNSLQKKHLKSFMKTFRITAFA